MKIVDTHIHAFIRGLDLAPVRRYVPDYDAKIEDYFALATPLGITHAVLVQPSFLGTDNSYMCSILRAHREKLRGIAVVDPEISEQALDELQGDGIVGIRLNLDGLPLPHFHDKVWQNLLASLKRRNWQVEIHREARDLDTLLPPLIAAGVNIVVDHFGRFDRELGVSDPGFRYLLNQAESGQVWVKISGAYRNETPDSGYLGAVEASKLLLTHFGAERLIWGSDWPHTRHESYINIEAMRDQAVQLIADDEQRADIFGATALNLFQF